MSEKALPRVPKAQKSWIASVVADPRVRRVAQAALRAGAVELRKVLNEALGDEEKA